MAESPPAVREKTFDFPERSVVTPLGYESAVACSSDSAACFLVTPAVTVPRCSDLDAFRADQDAVADHEESDPYEQ